MYVYPKTNSLVIDSLVSLGFSPPVSWHRTQLSHLSRRQSSWRLFTGSVAPGTPHPRLAHSSPHTVPAISAGRLHQSPHAPSPYPGRTCLDRPTPRVGASDPPRGFSASSSTVTSSLDRTAGSTHPAGVAPPQRSSGKYLPAAAPYRHAHW